MIRYDGIEVRYGDFVAIPDLDLTINDGEFFTFLGPSGCGKTTALRTLAGLTTPSGGQLWMDNRDISKVAPDKREVGMVFQNYALFPAMNVAQNIEFGLRVRKMAKAERDQKVREAADLVGLTDQQLTRNLSELSGGQQQRVAIARALVLQPKILLLDEPLSNLDAKLRQQMRVQLKRLQTEVGITMLYVTHDQDEALTMSDRVAVFNAGRVDQVGTPQEIYAKPATEFVCTFVGDATPLHLELLQAMRNGGDENPEALPVASLISTDKNSYLRAEKALLTPQPGRIGLRGEIVGREYHGIYSSYTIASHGSTLTALVGEGLKQPAIGEAVTVWIDPADLLQYAPTQNATSA